MSVKAIAILCVYGGQTKCVSATQGTADSAALRLERIKEGVRERQLQAEHSAAPGHSLPLGSIRSIVIGKRKGRCLLSWD